MKLNKIAEFMKSYAQTLESEQGVFRLKVTVDICKLMEGKRISKAELALRLNTSRANVTMMLSGDRNLTLDKLFEIYHCLGRKPQITGEIPALNEMHGSTNNIQARKCNEDMIYKRQQQDDKNKFELIGKFA